MANFNVFTPMGTTKNITVGSSSASVALPVRAGIDRTVRIFNGDDETVFIEFGTSTVAAVAATSMPIPAGHVELVCIGPAVTHVAAIAATGGGLIHFTEGDGA